jgi:peptidoglycan hydrolase-like protein with peptidoglycan-binding domain
MKKACGLSCAFLLMATLSPAQANGPSSQQTTQGTTSDQHSAKSTHKKSTHKKSSKAWRRRGQQRIDSKRALQIQQALIREHYLNGKPSGVWDQATQAAMQKYQADNGWQSKTTPDSRALIKLGLGPDHDHLLNPESAMTSQPPVHSVPTSAPANAASRSSDAQPRN